MAAVLTHFRSDGAAHMVDVGAKDETHRVAVAEGRIEMRPETLRLIRRGEHDKGDVLGVSRIAAIQAAKRTADLIPLCHPLPLTRIEVDLEAADEEGDGAAVRCRARAETIGRTGVEMEALTAVQIGLLAVYDMCKAVDRGMTIAGGASGGEVGRPLGALAGRREARGPSPMNDSLTRQLDRLEGHLREENPILLDAVRTFRRLDEVAWKLGLLPSDQSLASQVPWWPLIAVLGTFSAGKSTFINGYLGQTVQVSGNQAVDDRFTAICFSAGEGTPRALPGLALDADPRFPFYQVSRDIEEVAAGEGRRIDAYLQLKTCSSPQIRGKIIIDSPGFDADEQRTSVLRISDHIIGLADLVLVFFDARHPEPGAMQDTLRHLVERAVGRADSSKFLYILNQVDNTAREDNPEEVFGAWQRALASSGLTAGRFYQIYDEASAIPIENEGLRTRFRTKRDADLAEIRNRMEQVEVERAYRVIGMLEKLALAIRDEAVPALERARTAWRRRVLWTDAGLLVVLVAAAAGVGDLDWTGYGGRLAGDGRIRHRPRRRGAARRRGLRAFPGAQDGGSRVAAAAPPRRGGRFAHRGRLDCTRVRARRRGVADHVDRGPGRLGKRSKTANRGRPRGHRPLCSAAQRQFCRPLRPRPLRPARARSRRPRRNG